MLKKLFTFFAALTLSVGLWALDNVAYIDANGQSQTANGVIEITNATEQLTWGTAGQTTWYVVNGEDVQLAKGAICNGDVHLILADGAKLTATGKNFCAAIQVSGSNSLTIYAQSTDDQMGQLTATGAGSGAGIGGENFRSGSNITINGGVVTANGGEDASAIGNGAECESSASNIYISDAYVLKAGSAANPTDIIAHSSATDLSGTLTQQYVKMEGLATPYTREMTTGNWATVCLPYAATSFSGADFYKINYYDGVDKLYIEEVTSLVAGMPYIFQATAETVTIEHEGVVTLTSGEEQTERGLYGSFVRKVVESDGNQAALSNGSVIIAEKYAKVTVPACRAYFDMSEVPDSEQPHAAPLRCIGVPRQTPTGLGQRNKDEGQRTYKVLENGQFRIVRDGKEYNAQGQMIQ